VAVELCQQGESDTCAGALVNYHPAVTLKDIPVKLGLKAQPPSRHAFFSRPRHQPPSLRGSQQGNSWTCTLPELETYTVIVVNGARL